MRCPRSTPTTVDTTGICAFANVSSAISTLRLPRCCSLCAVGSRMELNKLSAACSCFRQLLQQYGNGYSAVTRRRYSSSIPARQQEVRRSADGVNLVPDAYSNARTKNENYGFRFRRNEYLSGMQKVRIGTGIAAFARRPRRENGRSMFHCWMRLHVDTCLPCNL